MSHRVIAVAAVAALSVTAAACGGDDPPEKAPAGADGATAKAAGAVTKVTGGRMSVAMTDFKFAPSKLTAGAGKLKVTAKNQGQQPHELVLLQTNKAANAIPLKRGQASETTSIGEISEQGPGKSASHTFKLKPGKYVYICNVDSHYKLGMRGSLVVK